ncbi:hypothetical protein [Leptolyngbya sp. NIES-2104]|uniref:hypothetical protein n=1 Tax=Leptolyngbya sp. NIES-2104 TaxID=1552121 RepID=UPI0006EC79D5|nr:hypothetical protein [Leptolyngbya sp. NIES-2104]GAP97067.1 hypothetical protein NIES2104_36140 [Leptolyngbya sp. NIES-2104]
MNTLKRIRQAVLLVLLMAFVLIAPMQAAFAADPSYSPGAPDSPEKKAKTLFEGRRNVSAGEQPQAKDLPEKIQQDLQNIDSDRPKTTGQWNREARETAGEPGERLGRIAKETGEAVKDFGKMYPDTAERSGDALQESLDRSN